MKVLKKIVFCLDNEIEAEFGEKVNSTCEYLKEEGIQAVIIYPSKEDISKETLLLKLFENSEEENLNDILFLTDSDLIAECLVYSGAYVVGIQHEGNGSENFPGLKYVFAEIDQVDVDSFIKAYQRYAKLPWDVLETERCLIRETTVEDVDTFYELYAHPEMTKYMEGLFENPEDEKRYTRDYIEKVYGLMGFGVWTVIQKETGKIIGRAGYSARNGFDDIELGFLIGMNYQRQGYAYEVCKAILTYGKEILLFPRVITFVKAENVASIKLCEKLGFTVSETVDIEENIYGTEYHDGERVSRDKAQFGKYIKMVIEF